jgi:hypothetical protein
MHDFPAAFLHNATIPGSPKNPMHHLANAVPMTWNDPKSTQDSDCDPTTPLI